VYEFSVRVQKAIDILAENDKKLKKMIEDGECCKNCDAVDRMKVLDYKYDELKKDFLKLKKLKKVDELWKTAYQSESQRNCGNI
jgi:hypothetical protein